MTAMASFIGAGLRYAHGADHVRKQIEAAELTLIQLEEASSRAPRTTPRCAGSSRSPPKLESRRYWYRQLRRQAAIWAIAGHCRMPAKYRLKS